MHQQPSGLTIWHQFHLRNTLYGQHTPLKDRDANPEEVHLGVLVAKAKPGNKVAPAARNAVVVFIVFIFL
jgi:hypothetical protein